jgi:hypothetical protein
MSEDSLVFSIAGHEAIKNINRELKSSFDEVFKSAEKSSGSFVDTAVAGAILFDVGRHITKQLGLVGTVIAGSVVATIAGIRLTSKSASDYMDGLIVSISDYVNRTIERASLNLGNIWEGLVGMIGRQDLSIRDYKNPRFLEQFTPQDQERFIEQQKKHMQEMGTSQFYEKTKKEYEAYFDAKNRMDSTKKGINFLGDSEMVQSASAKAFMQLQDKEKELDRQRTLTENSNSVFGGPVEYLAEDLRLLQKEVDQLRLVSQASLDGNLKIGNFMNDIVNTISYGVRK